MKYLILICSLFLNGSLLKAQSTFRYDLNKPDTRHQLPAILNEVSGLTDLDSEHVACVQDELGIIFKYNFRTGKIVSEHRFDSIGDFEGLTFINQSLYILRSDGQLTAWHNFPQKQEKWTQFSLPVVTMNNEGLAGDPKYNRLLIAAKSKPLNHDVKSERYIYAFDLTKNTLIQEPVYSLNVDILRDKVAGLNLLPTDTNSKGVIKPFNFRPSSLAVHPLTDEIYIISAADFMLVVMDRNGSIVHIKPLDKQVYPKAEGITFLKDGTMIITSEAGGKLPYLNVINFK